MTSSPNINTLNKFDIIKFAKNILNEVESIRSYTIATDEDTSQKYNVPTESRVNAFFRLIGLPMFVTIEDEGDKKSDSGAESGNRHLTPGFFGPKFDQYIIKDIESFGGRDIAFDLLIREEELKTIENDIGTDTSNENMARALRSSLPILPNIPSDINTIGGITIGNGTNFERYVYKKLFPLISSYIDISPKRNEMSRPFVIKESLQQIDNQTPLPKPFIETVARIRLISGSNAGDANEIEKNEDVSNALRTTVGDESYKEISTSDTDVFNSLRSTDTLESFIVIKLFESIFQLANQWHKLQKKQEKIFKKIPYVVSVKTASAKRSLFGKRANVSTDVSLDEKQELAKKYKKLNELIAKEEVFQTLLPSNDVIKQINNTAANRSTSLAALTDSFTELLNYNLKQLKKQKKRIETNINNKIYEVESLRVELETMTGEFTGLSIIDVVAVITALFIIDKKYLIALLDREVKDDMKTDSVLKSAIESADNPEGIAKAYEAIQQLEKIITFIFNMFITLVNDALNRKQRTSVVTKDRIEKRKSKRNLKNNTTMDMKTSGG
jgi:hypothetical protein